MIFAHRAAGFGTFLLLAFFTSVHAADQAALQSGQDTNWPGYNGGYDATRFSPLTQIDAKNVETLQEVGRLKIPETLSFQCGPVVVGDTMYFTTVKSTYAADARTGQ